MGEVLRRAIGKNMAEQAEQLAEPLVMRLLSIYNVAQ